MATTTVEEKAQQKAGLMVVTAETWAPKMDQYLGTRTAPTMAHGSAATMDSQLVALTEDKKALMMEHWMVASTADESDLTRAALKAASSVER